MKLRGGLVMLWEKWIEKHFPHKKSATKCVGGWLGGLYPTDDRAIREQNSIARPMPGGYDPHHVFGYIPNDYDVMTVPLVDNDSHRTISCESVIITHDTAEKVKELLQNISDIYDKITDIVNSDSEPPGPGK